MEEASIWFDKELRMEVEDIMVDEGLLFGDLQWWVAYLRIRIRGSGLYLAVDVALYAFLASRAQCWVLHDHIL